MTRIRFLLPRTAAMPGGNRTTARRIADALRQRGHDCALVHLDDLGGHGALAPLDEDGRVVDLDDPALDAATRARAEAQRPELLIALHAVHCGPEAARAAAAAGIPWILVFPGTDLNGKPPQVAVEAAKSAAAAVCFAPYAGQRARALYAPDRLEQIPQAARALPEARGGAPWPDGLPALAEDDFLILQPTGVRSVKAPADGIGALEPLARRAPRLKLWVVGPAMEDEEAERLRARCADNPWAAWLGPRTPEELAPLVRRADLVLSTSRSEGAAPNALLEAALFARPILARDHPMHRWFPGQPWLFHDDSDLRGQVRRLLDDPQPALLAARQLREQTRTRFDPKSEMVAWDRLVRGALA